MKRPWLLVVALALAVGTGAQDIQFRPAAGTSGITGGSCTNGYIESIDASGVPTCSAPSTAIDMWRTRTAIMLSEHAFGSAGAFVAIASGTQAFTSEANHPGYRRIACSTSANSGAAVIYGTTSDVLFSGDEAMEIVFRPERFTGVTSTMGWLDSSSIAASTDGIYGIINTSGAIACEAKSNTSTTTSVSTFTLTLDTWYRLRIVVNAAATSATCTVYSAAGSSLWSDSVASNLPTAAGRESAVAMNTWNSGSGSALALLDIDWVAMWMNKALTR